MILITGATGFIGSHLVEELVKTKEKIRVIIKNENLGFLNNINNKILKKINIARANLLDKNSLINACKGVEKVYHLAAISRPMNISQSVYYDVNVQGTKNLLEACRYNKVNKMIYVSSMSVIGFSRDGKALDENSEKVPVSDYGKSKKQAEEFALEFCKKNKIKLVVIRPPMVFGPRDLQFLKLFKLINTGFFPLLRGGEAKFEFCYVKNLLYGILITDKYGKNLEVYNINDGKTYTIKEVFSEIAKQEGKKLFPFSIPVLVVKIAGGLFEKVYGLFGKKAPFNAGTSEWMSKDNQININKIKKIGYKNKIPIEQSIKDTVNWYKREDLL